MQATEGWPETSSGGSVPHVYETPEVLGSALQQLLNLEQKL